MHNEGEEGTPAPEENNSMTKGKNILPQKLKGGPSYPIPMS
jgi:hypothetical protein